MGHAHIARPISDSTSRVEIRPSLNLHSCLAAGRGVYLWSPACTPLSLSSSFPFPTSRAQGEHHPEGTSEGLGPNLPILPSAVASPTAPTTAHSGSSDDETPAAGEDEPREPVRQHEVCSETQELQEQRGPQEREPQSVSALGAILEDAERQLRQAAAATAAAASELLASAGRALSAAGGVAAAQWEELRRLLGQVLGATRALAGDAVAAAGIAASATWDATRALVGNAAAATSVAATAAHAEAAACLRGLSKSLRSLSQPSWALTASMGAITTVAVVAAGVMWVSNRKLAHQVRTRDKVWKGRRGGRE